MVGVTPKLKYHCVEVVAGAGACEAARLLSGLRLLSADAPKLPLGTCDRPKDCDCAYRHFDDRRQGPRRKREHTWQSLVHNRTDRRIGRGRRETDDD